MYDKDYIFKAYYRVKGLKTRKSQFIRIASYHDLGEAWHKALNIAIENTGVNKLVDSIEIVES